MKAILVGLGLGLALSAAPLTTWAQADDAAPAWAYPVNPPDFKVQPDDGAPRHVPDSTAAFTLTQARDLFFALDWHPSDHPPLPDIVSMTTRAQSWRRSSRTPNGSAAASTWVTSASGRRSPGSPALTLIFRCGTSAPAISAFIQLRARVQASVRRSGPNAPLEMNAKAPDVAMRAANSSGS